MAGGSPIGNRGAGLRTETGGHVGECCAPSRGAGREVGHADKRSTDRRTETRGGCCEGAACRDAGKADRARASHCGASR